MQPQRRIGGAGRIGRCLLRRYRREVQLFCALAGDILVAGRAQPDLLFDEIVQVMPARADAVQHVGFEHRVIGDATKVYPVARKDALGPLQIVPDLGDFGIFQQRFEASGRFRQRQVIRTCEIESQRHVGGLSRRGGECDARDLGIGKVAPAGHHGEGACPCFANPADEAVELPKVVD